jgi:hypothetical protein
MSRVLNLILSHQEPAALRRVLDWWVHFVPLEDVLVVYGGTVETFDRLDFDQRVFVADPRLRTRDHPLERQSYTAVFQAASRWMAGRDFTHVYFAEFDHLPLAARFHKLVLDAMERERADALVARLRRVDSTNHPHYLHECSEPRFHPFWESISVRRDPRTVLTMIAPGSCWTRAAFDAIAARDEPFPIYLEIYLPTLAHHLGFRVRDLGEQNRWIHFQGERGAEIEAASAAGAWALHPVKKIELGYFDHLPTVRGIDGQPAISR